jgi:hypothetical protein
MVNPEANFDVVVPVERDCGSTDGSGNATDIPT